MRRDLLSFVAVSLSLIAGGCGSSSSSRNSHALATELSYFPPQTPFLAAIATDPQGAAVQNVNALLGAFPLAKLGINALESSLASKGINYQSEVEPLYGNPIVLGALQVPSASPLSPSSFLAVWMTKNAAKLGALVKGLRGFTAAGSADGATLYRSGSTTVALEGPTAVLGSSAAQVLAALKRHAHGGGTTSTEFSTATAALPRDALVRAYGTLSGRLGTTSARQVPWIGAIRGYEASLSASSTGLRAQFRLDTSGGSLTASQLPIAAGAAPTELAGTLPIVVGVRDPAQLVTFSQAVERTVKPAAAKLRLAHDLNTLGALLTGSLIIQSDTRTTMGRADVSDPALAARQLAKLPGVTRRPGGSYALALPRGKTLNLVLVGKELVAGLATPSQLLAFAAAPAAPAPNAQGALAVRISVLEVVRLALPNVLGQLGIAQAFLSTLGDVTGSASAAPEAITGQLALAVK